MKNISFINNTFISNFQLIYLDNENNINIEYNQNITFENFIFKDILWRFSNKSQTFFELSNQNNIIIIKNLTISSINTKSESKLFN